MKFTDIMEMVSDELYLVCRGETLYLMSSYRLGNPDFNYGIYDCCGMNNVQELEIPGFFMDGYFSWLQRDEMPNHYGIPEADILRIAEHGYADWTDEAKKRGYHEFAGSHNDSLCKYLGGSLELENFTEAEIEGFREALGEEELTCIEAYEKSDNELSIV